MRLVAYAGKKQHRASISHEAAVSGLFAIFYEFKDKDYFRIKSMPDTIGARQMLKSIGSNVDYYVCSIKANALTLLAKSDRRSNITWRNFL